MCKLEESIAKEILNEKYQKVYSHTQKVVELCKVFSHRLNINTKSLVLKAAWLHDVGKPLENIYAKKGLTDEEHKHNSAVVVLEVLQTYNYEDKELNDIIELIRWHRGDFCPQRLQLECSILRICDKLARYERGNSDAKDKCKTNKKTIIKLLKSYIDKFEEIYNELEEYEREIAHNR